MISLLMLQGRLFRRYLRTTKLLIVSLRVLRKPRMTKTPRVLGHSLILFVPMSSPFFLKQGFRQIEGSE